MTVPNQMTLNLWLEYWQRRLFLRDWQVDVSIVRRADAPEGQWPFTGLCSHSLEHKKGEILLLDPRDYLSHWSCDVELSLVHETLHLHYAPFEYEKLDSLEGLAQEQSLNAIALALINLKRGHQ